jgi:late competence protein required for DNA uptake (superfamily II DNA/RNA helicase)
MKTIRITESELVEMIQQIVTEKKKKKKKKKDRCHRCADQSYGLETSAYKSGAIVKCRDGEQWVGKKC